MSAQRTDPQRPAEPDEPEEGEGLDFEQVKEWAGFVVRAARRRPKLALTVLVTVAGLGIAVGKTLPSTYNSQVKLLAQRSTVLRTLTGINRDINLMDNPTKNAADMIQRRDNVVALVKEANLVERFEASRAPLLRLRDSVMATLVGPPSEEDKVRAIVATLETRLSVTSDETNVTISVDWPDPKDAYDIVTLVQKNFLEARYDSDVAVITDSIHVLEEHSKEELAKVDAALEEYQKIVAERVSATAPAATPRAQAVRVGGVVVAPPASAHVSPDLIQALEEKRQRIQALEQERQREIEPIKQQLAQAQLTLTPAHPTVVALQHQVDLLSEPTPELTALKADVQALMAQISAPPATTASAHPAVAQVAAPLPVSSPEKAAPPALPSPSVLAASASVLAGPEDGPTQLAHSRLNSAVRSYEEAASRIDAAKVELDITRTAFKYRFTVVTPAEISAKPKKPVAQIVGFVSVIAAALLALVAAALADLATGLILEPWQARRWLKVDLLGELRLPPNRFPQ